MDPAGRSSLHYTALTAAAAEVTRLIDAGESPDSTDWQGLPHSPCVSGVCPERRCRADQGRCCGRRNELIR